MLKTLNYCIITGIPGIGKTTLAEIIILHYIDKEYEVYKINSDIGKHIVFIIQIKNNYFIMMIF